MLASVLLLAACPLLASKLVMQVSDQRGRAVDDAVLTAVPVGGAGGAQKSVEGIMDQVDETFVPFVLPVPTGTQVQFPNHDDMRHHVYSFSDAKKFELPLYKGTEADPVTFDEPGVVVLGCNIHDWMKGYILITESPYYALSLEGRAEINDLPAGDYQVEVWHPRLRKDAWTAEVTISDGDTAELASSLTLKPALKVRRSPKAGKSKY